MTNDALESIIPPRSGEYTGPSRFGFWARPALAFVLPPAFFLIVPAVIEPTSARMFRDWQFMLLSVVTGLLFGLVALLLSRSFPASVRWDDSSLEVKWHTGPPQIIRWEEIALVRSAEVTSRGLPIFLGSEGENTWAKTPGGGKFTINSSYSHYEELKAALQAHVNQGS